jgi:DNA mismatch repair protein MutS2
MISDPKNPSLVELNWPDILKAIQSFASSGTGKMNLAGLRPAPSANLALQRVQEVFDGAEALNGGIRPFMESLDLFDSWHGRLKRKAVLKPLEIKDARSFCLETLALTEHLALINNDWSRKIQGECMDAEKPLSFIDQVLTPRGDIRSDASETLFRLIREKESLIQQIQSTLDRLVKDHDMHGYLQDRYVTTREGRWVLPIRSGRQHAVEGVIHGSSQTKQTVFMEPGQVVPLNNRLRQAEVEIEDEIERILTALSDYLAGLGEDFLRTQNALLEADMVFAKAQWSIQVGAQSFTFSQDEFFLVDVCHPLMQLSSKKPVPNTVSLDRKKSILLLSGPNAGGKTVLLKALGLAAQMARCGLPICAKSTSRLPFLENIHIGIGDAQSVQEELSTFAAHLLMLNQALELKPESSLILIDEICGSTDPEEGAAIARAFIEKFASLGFFSVITSHLGPLKTSWPPESQVLNGSMEYDNKSGKPSYIFLAGIPGDSLAIQTAKRVGIDRAIVERAIEVLSPTTRARLAGLEELDQLKSDIHQLRAQLKKDQARAQAEQDKYQKLNDQLEKEKEQILHKTVRSTEKKIDELLAEAKVEQTFKRHSALQEIKRDLPQIIKSTSGQPGAATETKSIQDAASFAKAYPPGSKIYVPHLQQDGVVQSAPNSKGEVFVLANSIRLNLVWSELKPPHQAQNPTAQLVRRSSATSVALSDQEKTIDVRGLTVAEALERIEGEIDLGIRTAEDRMKIIHGHGTEALKKAVRTFLSRSEFVKKWRAGSSEQGGDGVTWVELSVEN